MNLRRLPIVGLFALTLIHGLALEKVGVEGEALASRDPNLADLDERVTEPWYTEDYKALTNGLTLINPRYQYSSLIPLIGKDAFPIMINGRGETTVGGLNMGPGSGRVIVMGRREWCYHPNVPETLQSLIRNMVPWLAQKQENIKTATNFGNSIFGHESQQNVSPSQLASVTPDVYVIDAHAQYTDEEVGLIYDFVVKGGGLMIAGEAFSTTDSDFVEKYNSNRLTIKFGMFIGKRNYNRRDFPVTPMPVPEHNVYHALTAVGFDTGNTAVAANTLKKFYSECVRPHTQQLPDFLPFHDHVFSVFESLDAVKNLAGYSQVACRYLPPILNMRPKVLKPASNAAIFPGEVPASAPRVNKTITLDASFPEGQPRQGGKLFVSTGLYAAPGEVVEVTVPASMAGDFISSKVKVQVGIHKDNLIKRLREGETIKRSPQIVVNYDITSETTLVGNPWGGLIYLSVPRGVVLGEVEIQVTNVVEAPRFVHGIHTNADWTTIRDLPAPWIEFEVPGQIILSLPADRVRAIVDLDPEYVTNKWTEIMMAVNELAALTKRYRPERICLDTQISVGWMHSGYPIMGYLGSTEDVLFRDNSPSRMWGPLHELGHNHQGRSWTVSRTVETTCNLWSYYVNQKVLGMPPNSGRHTPDQIDRREYVWIAKGRPAEEWRVWLALDTYMFLVDMFGWQPYKRLHAKYNDMEPIKEEDDKLDTYARMFSQEVSKNLCPFFDYYRFPLSNETWAVCQGFPAPATNPIEKYQQMLADVPTSHGPCKEGWLAYGESCFLFSEEKRNWWDAEEYCSSLANDSHLASCFSTLEINYLADYVDGKEDYTQYFLGLSEMNPDAQFKHLDGSKPLEFLPWGKIYPQGDDDNLDFCGAFQRAQLRDRDCTYKSQFVCKTGPSSCAPQFKCPAGWFPWGSKCLRLELGTLTYEEAVAKCPALDPKAQILEINSMPEQKMIYSLLKRMKKDGLISRYYKFYIGIKDALNLLWESGAPVELDGLWCDGTAPHINGTKVVVKYSGNACWQELTPKKQGRSRPGVICQRPGN